MKKKRGRRRKKNRIAGTASPFGVAGRSPRTTAFAASDNAVAYLEAQRCADTPNPHQYPRVRHPWAISQAWLMLVLTRGHHCVCPYDLGCANLDSRSEEHTSELQ